MSRLSPLVALLVLAGGVGCDPPPETTAATPSATAAETAAATPTAAASPAPAPEPEGPKPSYDCPEGSKGPGTLKEPCLATGNQRLVEIAWNGKIGDKGPTFKVTNNAKHDVLYGNVLLYFYDQSGKQLEVGPAGKTKKRLQCAGNIFAGAVKPGEKIFVNFSCCKKDDVPEGAVTIEGELKTAGFADASGGRSDTYWQNTDLVPEDRPKGGIK